MKIVNQPKIILTVQEAVAFNDTIRLLKSITAIPEISNTDLIEWVGEACISLENIWQHDSIDVE